MGRKEERKEDNRKSEESGPGSEDPEDEKTPPPPAEAVHRRIQVCRRIVNLQHRVDNLMEEKQLQEEENQMPLRRNAAIGFALGMALTTLAVILVITTQSFPGL